MHTENQNDIYRHSRMKPASPHSRQPWTSSFVGSAAAYTISHTDATVGRLGRLLYSEEVSDLLPYSSLEFR